MSQPLYNIIAVNCAALPTANVGEYATSNCKTSAVLLSLSVAYIKK